MQTIHDVVIIGSGAAGAMAAWNLSRQGVNVLVLDAGEKFQRAKFWTHVKPWEWRERLDRGERPVDFELSKREQPYVTPPAQPFDLVRVWGRGGKTNIWGRVALRYSDLDFTSADRDGWEIPWPIRYADIAPYYDKVEQFIGVCGGTDDQDSLPGSKYYLPPPAMRCGEVALKRAANSVGISVVPVRRAVLTRPHNGHSACHYCGACGRGCDVSAFFNASDYLMEPALKTGRVQVIDNAVVAQVLAGDDGLANGVLYFDRVSGAERTVKARIVVVGASCIDSTRILLNSKSERYPNGIGNSSDAIGRYLTEQIRFHMYGFVPELRGKAARNDDGIGGEHIYMPRFNHRGKKRDYLRGFGSQFWNTGAQANANWAKDIPGFGASFKKGVKAGTPPWWRCTRMGKCCRVRTTGSRSIRRRRTATECRWRASITRSARTSGSWRARCMIRRNPSCMRRRQRFYPTGAGTSIWPAVRSTNTARAAWARTRSAPRSTPSANPMT
jgi:ferredoxin